MTTSYPAFAVFPDLNCILRLPTGSEYRGKLRQHPSSDADGEFWYEGYLRAQAKEAITADTTLKDNFNRDGAHPAYFHSDSNLEPLRLKLNRIPAAKRTEKNANALVGEIWNHDGLWTVVASPSESEKLHAAGNVVPSRHEVAFAGSRIRQYVEPAPAAAAPEVAPEPARKAKPARASARPS